MCAQLGITSSLLAELAPQVGACARQTEGNDSEKQECASHGQAGTRASGCLGQLTLELQSQRRFGGRDIGRQHCVQALELCARH